MRKLRYVGTDDWHRPVYKDERGKLWIDTNMGNGTPDLYRSTSNDLDGEPDYEIDGEYEIIEDVERIDERKRFSYMMLSRLKSDCKYFLGYGNRNLRHLSDGTVAGHIEAMKKIWNGFAEDEKPEWLSMEEICEYERKMMAPDSEVD